MSASRATKADAADRQKKIIAGVVFGAIALGVIYWEIADPGSPAPAAVTAPVTTPAVPARPAATTGTPARAVGTTSGALDPTLHMQAMLVTEAVLYNGTGRNVFAVGGAAPVEMKKIPMPVAPVRTGPQVSTPVANLGPPPPPPIPLKFFGIATSGNGSRKAFLLHGDDVFLAANGDIVQRKYRVINVGPNSVQVEDLTTNNKQTLPLQANP